MLFGQHRQSIFRSAGSAPDPISKRIAINMLILVFSLLSREAPFSKRGFEKELCWSESLK